VPVPPADDTCQLIVKSFRRMIDEIDGTFHIEIGISARLAQFLPLIGSD